MIKDNYLLNLNNTRLDRIFVKHTYLSLPYQITIIMITVAGVISNLLSRSKPDIPLTNSCMFASQWTHRRSPQQQRSAPTKPVAGGERVNLSPQYYCSAESTMTLLYSLLSNIQDICISQYPSGPTSLLLYVFIHML